MGPPEYHKTPTFYRITGVPAPSGGHDGALKALSAFLERVAAKVCLGPPRGPAAMPRRRR